MKIIAESAFNHNGDLAYLMKLADASKYANAHLFAVQVMNVESFCVKDYSKYSLYKDTEITDKQWLDFFSYCRQEGIEVLPCTLDISSLDLCLEAGFRNIKIHATDLTNDDMLDKLINVDGVRVFLETQCATMIEVDYAVKKLADRIEALFTGYSNYPTEIEDLNLNVIDHFEKRYELNYGYADHSLDKTEVPLMILAKGYHYLEKHITLTRNNRRFDYEVSLYPEEFKTMVAIIDHYKKALGNGVKHPAKNEAAYRKVMYKKVIPGENSRKRHDEGKDSLTALIESFDQSITVAAIIARLKSQRLKKKVLLPLHNDSLISDLYSRVKHNCSINQVVLATSYESTDDELVEEALNHEIPVLRGDPDSVLDRLLEVAIEYRAGYIFRITGDNPFSDPEIMNKMVQVAQSQNVDYVRVNGTPFGLSPELISSKYLWNLYLKFDNTHNSEYLTWFILNDKACRKAALDFEDGNNYEMRNLSIDYEHDYLAAHKLLENFNEIIFKDIKSNDLFRYIDLVPEETDKEIKLPDGKVIKLSEYLDSWWSCEYEYRENLELL